MPFRTVRLLSEDDQGCPAPSVLLAAKLDTDDAKWIQIAYEGEWKGHHQGAFKLSRDDFDAILRNFRRHPAYLMGGKADVVPFDFDHASEMPATHGTIPMSGKPAQGWVRELEIRNGPGGKAQLWALSRALEPARSYLRDGKIRWVSAAIRFNVRDFVTDEPIGAELTSVAFTNQPFLRALPAIAASARSNNPQGHTDMKPSPLLLATLSLAFEASEKQIEDAVVTLSADKKKLEAENQALKRRFAEEDVDQAIVTYGLSAQSALIRPSLLADRLADEKGFAERYPKPKPGQAPPGVLMTRQTPAAPPPQVSHLSATQLGATVLTNGVQSPLLAGIGQNGVMMNQGGGATMLGAGHGLELVRTLAMTPGRNKTERAMNLLKSKPGGDKLSHEDLHAQACMMLSNAGVPAHVVDVHEILGAVG